ncbi:MAG: hypothetical protein Q4Q23_07620, partial [Methanobacteriaceae archaeon]|nr:hypothetical protein [Methanobacteriaceae archaeon]
MNQKINSLFLFLVILSVFCILNSVTADNLTENTINNDNIVKINTNNESILQENSNNNIKK